MALEGNLRSSYDIWMGWMLILHDRVQHSMYLYGCGVSALHCLIGVFERKLTMILGARMDPSLGNYQNPRHAAK